MTTKILVGYDTEVEIIKVDGLPSYTCAMVGKNKVVYSINGEIMIMQLDAVNQLGELFSRLTTETSDHARQSL